MSSKTYTVIGYHPDNNQPWVEHVEAPSPLEAAIRANPDDIVVVEVIEGKHYGVLHSGGLGVPDTTLSLDDLIGIRETREKK